MTFLDLPNGERTRIRDTGGDLPALVLVHGLANSIEIWDRVLPRLARRFRVIAFDLPGPGQRRVRTPSMTPAFSRISSSLCSTRWALLARISSAVRLGQA